MTKLEAIWADVEHWLELWETVEIGQLILWSDICSYKCLCCEYDDDINYKKGFALPLCSVCPIMEYTGKSGCDGTPYEDVDKQLDKIKYTGADDSDIKLLLDLVEDEYQFLVDVALLESTKQ